jgi:predicted short-subunit dehydrogenase-like oxidoreductase (DUF2520 family)
VRDQKRGGEADIVMGDDRYPDGAGSDWRGWQVPALRVIGPGRAGGALQRALRDAGWAVVDPLRRGDELAGAAAGVDLLVIAAPDGAIAETAAAVEPADAVVAHLAGSLGLEVLAPHARRAALHPLRSIPAPDTDLTGAWFAVAGDPLVERAVADLGGHAVEVADEHRAAHHAAATIASNHLVALLGQVERVAATAGVPLAAYLDLVRQTVDNVERLGPAAALTGPVRRGDWATVERHLEAIAADERDAYRALSKEAEKLCA